MKKVILFIRRDQEYFLEGKIKKHYYSPSLKGWNMFFKYPYLKFRKRLSEIASLSYSLNNFDYVYLWGDYKKLEKNKEDIIVPIDEDDWISKDLVMTLKDFSFDEKRIVRWNVTSISHIGKVFKEKRGFCRSCEYAVFMPVPIKLIRTNTYISKLTQIKKIDKALSVKIDNISSISFLWHHSFEKILNIVKNKYLIEDIKLLKEYKNLVDLYNELLIDLYKSCKV